MTSGSAALGCPFHVGRIDRRFTFLPDRTRLHVVRNRLVRMPYAVGILCDLFERASGRDTFGPLFDDVAFRFRFGELVALLDEKPRVLAILAALATAHEHPAAVKLLTVERELEPPFPVIRVCLPRWLPRPAIPQEHRASAVLFGRDDAFEVAVLDGVILGLHRETANARIEARAFRHGPAQEHAVQLETEVVVHVARAMLLNDEREPAAFALDDLPFGLGGDREIALLVV